MSLGANNVTMRRANRRFLVALVVLVGVGGAGIGAALGKEGGSPASGAAGPASSRVIHTLSSGLFDLQADTKYGKTPDIYYSITNTSSGSNTYSYFFVDQSGNRVSPLPQTPRTVYNVSGTVTVAGGQSTIGRVQGFLLPASTQYLRFVLTEQSASGVAATAKPFLEVTYYQVGQDVVYDQYTNDDPKDTPNCCITSAIVPLENFTDTVTVAAQLAHS